MNDAGPVITGVRGGVLAVQTDVLKHLGREFADACWRFTRWTGADAIVMAEPDLIASASLSPATYVEAERALMSAVGHLGEVAAEWGALAALVEGVGQWFGGGEDQVRRLLDDQLGTLIGKALRTNPEVAAVGALSVAAGSMAWWLLSSPEERIHEQRDVERFITRHPALVRDVAGTLDGVLEGLTGVRTPAGDSAVANLTAQLYRDEGIASVEPRPGLTPVAPVQPRTVTDVIHHLRRMTAAPGSVGVIEIQTWRGPDGQPRHVVYLPGTDDMNLLSADTDIRDVAEDLRVASGGRSAYREGVEQAMRDAGIGPHDPVLIAGHSLGGMTAVKELSEGVGFNVTNVITAGSPTAIEKSLPPTAHVLSLESSGDIVPQVEGRPNPITPQQTTVTFTSGEDTIVGNHALSTYERGAEAIDASGDPVIRAAVQTMGPFFAAGTDVSTATFQVTRASRQDRG